MRQHENLLITLTEYCANIQEAVSKSFRFGLQNHHPDKPDITNTDVIMKKYYQIGTLIELLQEYGKLPVLSEDEIKKIREDTMKSTYEWMEVSLKTGNLRG